jgi:hypothetical protein
LFESRNNPWIKNPWIIPRIVLKYLNIFDISDKFMEFTKSLEISLVSTKILEYFKKFMENPNIVGCVPLIAYKEGIYECILI